MTKTATHRYRAYGLDILSDIALPELPKRAMASHPHEVRIALATTPATSELQGGPYAFHRTGPDAFRMHIPEAADFTVAGGTRIDIAPLPDHDPGLLRLFTIGSAIGMLLHQRELLVMHASAVLRDGKATLFIGDSGSGKSTTAAQFAQAGHPVLADDVMPVFLDTNGHAVVRTGSQSFKLWGNSLDALGLPSGGLQEVANRADKFHVPNPLPAADLDYPVGRIVYLEPVAEAHTGIPPIQRLLGIEALREIAANTYRPEYLDLLGRRAAHFQQCARLAEQVPMFRLRRHVTEGQGLASIVDLLEQYGA